LSNAQKWLLIGGGLFVAFIIGVTALGASAPEKKQKAVAQATVVPTTTEAPTTTAPPTTTTTTEAPKAFPGQRDSDQLADASGRVELSGGLFTDGKVAATVSGWSRTRGLFDKKMVCASVVIENHDSDQQRYSEGDWKLQVPSGDVLGSEWLLNPTGEGLGLLGTLAPGGTKQGSICFEDTGERGQFVVNWAPGWRERGIWLVSL
jgi:hypothetical protein